MFNTYILCGLDQNTDSHQKICAKRKITYFWCEKALKLGLAIFPHKILPSPPPYTQVRTIIKQARMSPITTATTTRSSVASLPPRKKRPATSNTVRKKKNKKARSSAATSEKAATVATTTTNYKDSTEKKSRKLANFKTQTLSSFGITKGKQPEWKRGTKVLLDESIYGNKVPENLRNKYFTYELVSIDNALHCTLVFKDRIIDIDGDEFIVFSEGVTEVSFFLFIIRFFYFNSFLAHLSFSTCQIFPYRS